MTKMLQKEQPTLLQVLAVLAIIKEGQVQYQAEEAVGHAVEEDVEGGQVDPRDQPHHQEDHTQLQVVDHKALVDPKGLAMMVLELTLAMVHQDQADLEETLSVDTPGEMPGILTLSQVIMKLKISKVMSMISKS